MKQGFNKKCERCGKEFYAYPYNAHTRRFCSTNCSNKTTNVQQKETKRNNSKKKYEPSDNKKWRHNIAYYEWRDACIERDGEKCQRCGKEQEKRWLVVHHIAPWDKYPQLRYDISNGIVLCRGCHNIIHILPNRKENKGY